MRFECRTATECRACFQLDARFVGAVFRPGKNQRAVEIGALEQRHEQIEFLLGRDRINGMRHRLGRRAARADLDHFRLAQNPGGEPLDLRRQRRGEKQRLPIGRNLFDDPAHVGQKTHVEHAIDFIEHEDVDVAEIHRALLEQIEQAARRGADDVRSARGFFPLFPVTDAAVHDRDAQIGEAPVIAKGRFDLRGQLARRLEHETTKSSVLGEQGQDRQREGRRFAGAGLRGADQIFAGENDGKARSWIGVGSVKPIACVPRTTSGESPKLLKDTGAEQ